MSQRVEGLTGGSLKSLTGGSLTASCFNYEQYIVLTHTAQRCRSETEKIILEDIFSSELPLFKKYHPSENLKYNNLGIFQS